MLCSSFFLVGYLTHILLTLDTSTCQYFHSLYQGRIYTTPQTLSTECVYESRWLRLMNHHVKYDSEIIDWLYIDCHDRVNVLVQHPKIKKEFIVLQQSKYAIKTETLAILYGKVKSEEKVIETVIREMKDKLGVGCRNIIELGSFVTDVNKGMGKVYSYLALDCEFILENQDIDGVESERENDIGIKDLIDQKVLLMNTKELSRNVKQGKFQEVQWSNTVSLALMRDEINV